MSRLIYIAIFAALFGAVSLWMSRQVELRADTSAEEQAMAKMTLEFPDHNRPVIVEVYVGPLPPGAELILETPGGVFVGAISFFGLSDNLQEGQPQIVVTREELPQDRISVVGRVVHNGVSRVATKDELQGVRLVAE